LEAAMTDCPMTVTYPVVTSIEKPGFLGFFATRLTLLGRRFVKTTDDNPYLMIDSGKPCFSLNLGQEELKDLLVYLQKLPLNDMNYVNLSAIPVLSIFNSSNFFAFWLVRYPEVRVVYIPRDVCLDILGKYPKRFKKVSRRFSKIIRDRHRKD
jgi:hypothetical protein